MARTTRTTSTTRKAAETVETPEVVETVEAVETPVVETPEVAEATETEGTEAADEATEAPKGKSTTRNAAVMEAKRVALKRLKAEHPEAHALFQGLWDEEKAARGITARSARSTGGTVTVLRQQTQEQAARIAELEALLAAGQTA
jgi:hypothetical protein